MADSEDKPVKTVKTNDTEAELQPVETAEGAVAVAEAPAVKKAPKRRKVRRTVASGHVHIQATFNNTLITITDSTGNLIAFSSAGSCGFRGSKKGTAYAAQVASEKAANEAHQNFGLAKVDVFVKGIGQGREAAIRALQNVDIFVSSVADVTGIPHGGCRPRKARRV